MEKQLISFKTAKLAKKRGFDWKCLYYYNIYGELIANQISFWKHEEQAVFLGSDSPDSTFISKTYNVEALLNSVNTIKLHKKSLWDVPTQSLLQKWLRDAHNFHIEIHNLSDVWWISIKKINSDNTLFISESYDNYEEVLERGLQKALKLI